MPRTFPYLEFKNTSKANPYWSSWTCFCEVIEKRKNISNKTMKKYFDKLIDKNDYTKKERVELLKYLFTFKNDE